MKVRKLAVALALAGGLGSGVAHALGLGEIELQSYLNEPMDAEIVLPQSQGVDPDDVFVNIAPERAYQRLGLERNQFLGKLRFDVTTLANGSLVVNVSSREPLREPYLNFLLELTWPNGRLMREYAVLVDPPVYAEDSGIAESVSAPSSTPAAQSPSTSSTRSAESARRQARIEQSGGSGSQSRTFGPTGPSDTLWTIAASVRPDSSLSMQQVMLALQDLNPNAFIGNNINRLKRGEVLRVPTADQIRGRTHAEATQLVAQQNREFEQARRTVDATAAQPAAGTGAGEAASGGDELRLLVADDEGGRNETEGGSAGGDGQLAGGVDAGSAVAMEELESARRENDELNSRVDDLQDQVATLQRLLELKNSQLAEMQQGFSADDEGAAPQGAPVAGSEDAATGQEDAVTDQSESAGEEGELGGEEGLTAAEPGDVAVDQEGTVADATDPAVEAGQEGDDTAGAAAGDAEVTGDLADQPAEATAPEAEAAAGEPETEITEAPAAAQPAVTEPQSQPKPVADKGFPGNVMDAIASNTMYQIALGGGLILLLLILLLLARRNANREKAFYEQLNNETEGPDNDAFDLTLEEEPEQSVAGDALEEADTYVAYGRYDQAAQVLESAISREPSRTDLRLKLLSVYADNQDRESFEKQFGEVQALEDGDAIAQASELRARLEEAESMPSIDDLESQLRSGSFGEETDVSDIFEQEESEPAGESEVSAVDETDDVLAEDEKKSSDDLIEYDLSGLTLPETEEPETEEAASDEESDFSSLEIDLDEEPETKGSFEESFETNSRDLDSLDSLDETFLDELDAELDKVAGEDDELGGADMEESTLDDLELDVSDEDLALMEEFSDSADSANAAWDGDELSLDDELELEDSLNEGNLLGEVDTSNPEQQVSDLEELEALDDSELDELSSLGSFADEDLPLASDEVQEESPKTSVTDIDESDLGDDDDFDFLAGTDEAATKLDLARAYIEMGDSDGARDILEEVALEGDDAQKSEAQDLLKNLS